MAHALDLPEIRAHIAQFLDEGALTVCLFVCRDWYDTLLPLRWRRADIVGVHSVRADVRLRKHAHHIRSLSFLRLVSLKHLTLIERYNRLERLRVCKAEFDGRIIWEKIATLARQNTRTLRTMIFEDMWLPDSFLDDMRDTAEGSSRTRFKGDSSAATPVHGLEAEPGPWLDLDELTWKRVTCYLPSLNAFWKASRRAKTVVLECVTVKIKGEGEFWLDRDVHANFPTTPQTTSISSNPVATISEAPTTSIFPSNHPLWPDLSTFCRVQNLRISWTISLPLELQLRFWIWPCVELRSLTWEAYAFPDSLCSTFADSLRSKMWPFLTSLSITSCKTMYPSDDSIAQILDASPNLFEKLVFKNVDFGSLAFNSLRRHFPRLRTMTWICCWDKVTSAMTREVLELCSQLETLHAPYLLMEDIRIPPSVRLPPPPPPLWKATPGSCQGQKEGVQESAKVSLAVLPSSALTALSQSPRQWVCQNLSALYIESALPSYSSPPLTSEDEEAIWERLRAFKRLERYSIGPNISPANGSRFM